MNRLLIFFIFLLVLFVSILDAPAARRAPQIKELSTLPTSRPTATPTFVPKELQPTSLTPTAGASLFIGGQEPITSPSHEQLPSATPPTLPPLTISPTPSVTSEAESPTPTSRYWHVCPEGQVALYSGGELDGCATPAGKNEL